MDKDKSYYPDFDKETKQTIPIEKKKVNIEIYRKDNKTYFKFEIDPRIEKLYKDISEEIKESKGWEDLSFYLVPKITRSEDYKSKLNRYRLFDDYGVGLLDDDKLNIAWIRTVGGKGEILIREPISFAELSLLFRNAIQFIKEHFEEQFQDFRIKGTLEVEI